ncbi:AfsR/SARP family transcriptional regulator [Streptomyces collinus]|uniref:Putative AfsR-like transcriptional regulator n=1 Tax=Streptomyces collinus (strain DSM 40733 / Tue 365) TaxID=1214242 RepID=S5VUR6_STRC3|nr:BTAD domain-containing putative transcriptional regulator [Streptomyces collinus]AGS71550.1 putative AfsR-like transcriptional regulator [Streptomyces collinus Tu 365]UJA10197.1 tetratricopeptide repeat protein [Streptomyces collinus]UJA14939.1 tetratricopeptide repeat protein [Streptomyces collinus]
MGERLRFEVLGPVTVTSQGRSLPVGGARQRTVLALLLLNSARIVPVDTLVDAVWNDRPPATARTQIAIVIAALRKTFKSQGAAEDIILTAHPGYVLRPDGHSVDVLEFTRLVKTAETAVQQARLPEAAAAYTQALALWRGPAFAGISSALVEDEAARLEGHRLNAYDDATAVQLELGNHHDLVPELVSVVREHPLRERTRHHLMLAQYRSGRRAEAMATFREARTQFIEELGMEPGPDLQGLHDAILRDDPSLAPAPAVPATDASRADTLVVPSELPPDVPGFTGRAPEFALLDTLVASRDRQHGPAIGLITGIAGVGKTGLAVRWSHRAAQHFPDGRLFADLRGYDEHHEPTPAWEAMSRFLRSLGVSSDQIPTQTEDLVALYRSVLAERRVLLVLDNVRSFAQIHPLLPGSGGCAVLVTSREQLEELVTWPQDARVHLGVLPGADAVELLGRIVGEERVDSARADTRRLADLCDRLPLALRIAAARLASKPHWTVRHLVTRLGDERRRLDELSQGAAQVRASFELSYRYLPDDAARLYRRLGLLDAPDFAAWVGGALLDVDVLDAERLMEDLVDAQFLEVVGVDATGRLRYRLQNLMRLYARERAQAEEPEPDQRAARERALRTWLSLAEEAHRREYGGHFSVVHSPAPRRPLDRIHTDELLSSPLEWLEAERLSLVAAVGQAAGLGLDDLAWDLTVSAAVLFETRHYLEDWRECAEVALESARTSGNLRGQAAMLHQLGGIAQAYQRLPEAHARYSEAMELFERAGEPHGLALNLRNLSILERFSGDLDLAMTRLERAGEIFRTVGDVSSEAHALDNMAQIELERGNTELAMKLGVEAVQVMESIDRGSKRGVAQTIHRLGRVHLARSDFPKAEEAFLQVIDLVQAKSDLVGLAYALLGLGEARLGAGDVDAAEATLSEALDVVERIDSPLVDGQINLVLGEARSRQGRLDSARERANAAHAVFLRTGSPRWRAQAEGLLSRLDERPAPGTDASG